MKQTIPIMHCFDNNYVMPAGVAFFSMLMHANPDHQYKLFVLHSDISLENQNKLKKTIKKFSNATLDFIQMSNRFDDLFNQTHTKAHYSKEIFYKFLAPSLFEEYDKIMIADVDVVYLDDISINFNNFDPNDNKYYLAACKGLVKKGSDVESYMSIYEQSFSKNEIDLLYYGAGYYIYNLKKMRSDKIEEKLIKFAIKNCDRLIQPEQDTVNIVCGNKIKTLPPNTVVCTYSYNQYLHEEDYQNDLNWLAEDVKDSLNNPLQLHFATDIKPWNNFTCSKSEIWFQYLAKTPFFHDFFSVLNQKTKNAFNVEKNDHLDLLSIKIPFTKISLKIRKTP